MAKVIPGSTGTPANTPPAYSGTSSMAVQMPPGPSADPTAPAPQTDAPTTDPAIEALDLEPVARAAAYELKAAQPSVTFTSGRRSKADQARAMASHVVKKRKWIELTYKKSELRTSLQDWVDDNPDQKTKAEIAAGLLSVFDAADDTDALQFSLHMTGMAFDIQPVVKNAADIKKSIRGLKGLAKFLEMEGGQVVWHAQFKDDPPDDAAPQ